MKQIGKTLYAANKDGSVQQWSVFVDGNVVIVEYGKHNGKLQTKQTVCESKNVGKVNETTPEQQATLEAESKYRDQIRKGYVESIEDVSFSTDKTRVMLAQDASKKPHFVKYPCHTQPKLDGNRCLVTFDEDGEPVFNSRGAKVYPKHEHLAEQLKQLRAATGFDSFDGELYIHGIPLQKIVSLVKKVQPDSSKLEYRIYDVPSEKVWSEREKDLTELSKHIKLNISTVPVTVCNNEQEAKESIHNYMDQGYEGTILRNLNGKYEFGQRSNDLLKWKVFESTEALVYNVGIDKNGEGVLLCKMQNGIEFRCKMKGTHEERLYEEQLKLVGKYITFTYQTLTVDGVPQFPVGASVRELNENWEPLE